MRRFGRAAVSKISCSGDPFLGPGGEGGGVAQGPQGGGNIMEKLMGAPQGGAPEHYGETLWELYCFLAWPHNVPHNVSHNVRDRRPANSLPLGPPLGSPGDPLGPTVSLGAPGAPAGLDSRPVSHSRRRQDKTKKNQKKSFLMHPICGA